MNAQEQAEQAASTALATITAEFAELELWEIDTAEENDFAADMLRDVKARHKALEDKRKTITKPLNAATKAVNDLFRPPRQLLERAEKHLKRKIAGYLEAQAVEQAAAVQAVAVAETPEQAVEALDAIQPAATTPAGVTVRYVWRAVVFSPDIVPDEFRMIDLEAIQAHTNGSAKMYGEPTPIPGVRFEKESIVTSRAVKS